MQKNHFNLFTKFLNATLHILNIFSLIIYLKMERRSVLIIFYNKFTSKYSFWSIMYTILYLFYFLIILAALNPAKLAPIITNSVYKDIINILYKKI